MKVTFKLLVIAVFATLSFASCLTPKKVNYLQDMHDGSQIVLENKFQAQICPYDELDISVYSADEELAKPFNIGRGVNTNSVAHRGAYLVDVNGDIEFPVFGKLHVSKLTRLELQDTIKNRLQRENLLTDAVVMVRFANFKVFFLGAEGGKAITISNERCTFLEALAMSGDLSLYTRRDKIAVMREVDGKMVTHYLDPRSSEVFKDPFFMLQQNDFIITQKYTRETPRSEAYRLTSWLSIGLSCLTFVTTLYTIYNSK